jgi:hypothetical protein
MLRVKSLVLLIVLSLLGGCAGLSSTQQRMLTGTALGAAAALLALAALRRSASRQ